MSPGSVYSGVAGPEYINFRTFGNTCRRCLGRSDAGSRSGLGGRRGRGRTSDVLDEHILSETVCFLHVHVVMALAGITDFPELLIPQLPARFAEGLEGVLRLARHDNVRHETQEVALARHVGQILRDAHRLSEHLLRDAALRAKLLLILLEHALMLAHYRYVAAAQFAEARILRLALMVHERIQERLMLHGRVVDLAAQEVDSSVHAYLRVGRTNSCKLRAVQRLIYSTIRTRFTKYSVSPKHEVGTPLCCS